MVEDSRRAGWGKRSQLVGNLRQYREGYEEGGAGQGRGKKSDNNMVWIV